MEEQEKYLPTNVEKSPVALMMIAIEKNLDLDKVEKAMALQERWEANEARKAYHDAMAGFKANPPEIEKDKQVEYGNTKYSHASLANVTSKINAAMSKHGLSAAWNVSQVDKTITVTCTITHRLGHSESTSLSGAPDISGSKNAIQAVGSTISYLERYTILALTGLATHDMDDDSQGAGVGPEFISTEQAAEINSLLDETNSDVKAFLAKIMKAESVEKILASDYNKAKIAIAEKKKKLVPSRVQGQEG